jgi:hypothetical protein
MSDQKIKDAHSPAKQPEFTNDPKSEPLIADPQEVSSLAAETARMEADGSDVPQE